MNKEYWEEQQWAQTLSDSLKVGVKIKIGKEYSKKYSGFESGEVVELIEAWYEEDNGLYCHDVMCPSLLSKTEDECDPHDSIYHLFGNKMENWMDNEIIKP